MWQHLNRSFNQELSRVSYPCVFCMFCFLHKVWKHRIEFTFHRLWIAAQILPLTHSWRETSTLHSDAPPLSLGLHSCLDLLSFSCSSIACFVHSSVSWVWHLYRLLSLIHTHSWSSPNSTLLLFCFSPPSLVHIPLPVACRPLQIISQAPGAQAGLCLFSFPTWRTSNLGEREGEQMTTGSWPFLPQFNSSPPCPPNVAIRLGRSDTLIWAWSGSTHNHSVTFHLYAGATGKW